MTHTIRANLRGLALAGLTLIAASCESTPTAAATPDTPQHNMPPAAPGGVAVDLFAGVYRDGWAGEEYRITQHDGYYRLLEPGGTRRVFTHGSSATLKSKNYGTLTLGTLQFPNRSHSVLHAEIGHKQLLLIKQR